MSRTEFSTSQLARELGVYEEKVRRLHRLGVLMPRIDIFGRRIFSSDDIRRGRQFLDSKSRRA